VKRIWLAVFGGAGPTLLTSAQDRGGTGPPRAQLPRRFEGCVSPRDQVRHAEAFL